MSHYLLALAPRVRRSSDIRSRFTPSSIAGLQGWLSTVQGTFLFGDGTRIPAHGKLVHQAFNVPNQEILFGQATSALRPTWDATTYDIPCMRSNGTQYLERVAALAEPGLVIICAAMDGLVGNQALTGARSTGLAGGDVQEDAWALRRTSAGFMEALVSSSTGQFGATTPQITGEKIIVMLRVVGTAVQVWLAGATGDATLAGTRLASDGDQALFARYYNNLISAIMEGGIFEFAQYSPAPGSSNRRLLVKYFQQALWPAVAGPAAATVDAGQIEQGSSKSIDVVTPSTGAAKMLASIDEQPAVGAAAVSGSAILVTVPAGAALGAQEFHYCLRSDVTGSRLVDFGRVAFEVIAGGTGPTTTLPEDQPLPAVEDTINANTGNLAGQYAAADAGDHLVLAAGNYGSFNFNRSFPANNPLVIRAATELAPVFTTVTMSGSGQILSGVTIDQGDSVLTGVTLRINGSNVRVTRCVVQNGRYLVNWGPGSTDTLVDHCNLLRSKGRTTFLDGPRNQNNIIVSRCWVNNMLYGSDAYVDISTGFSWNEANSDREKAVNIIVRFCYCGPLAVTGAGEDWIHAKISNALYAFNQFVGASSLLSFRFGLRTRAIGNYAPSKTVNMWDELGWYYGNNFADLDAPAGRSGYYDDTKNLPVSVGGFHACKRCRVAGNNATMLLGKYGNSNNWCTAEAAHPQTLPDPQAAGGIKALPRSFGGVTYAADNPNHPDIGIKIRAHVGAVTSEPPACIVWAQNVSNVPGDPAPASWLSELQAEHPWITGICPNPTSQTGGPGNTAPWSIAQALTPGNAANPNTGVNRNSPGGRP